MAADPNFPAVIPMPLDPISNDRNYKSYQELFDNIQLDRPAPDIPASARSTGRFMVNGRPVELKLVTSKAGTTFDRITARPAGWEQLSIWDKFVQTVYHLIRLRAVSGTASKLQTDGINKRLSTTHETALRELLTAAANARRTTCAYVQCIDFLVALDKDSPEEMQEVGIAITVDVFGSDFSLAHRIRQGNKSPEGNAERYTETELVRIFNDALKLNAINRTITPDLAFLAKAGDALILYYQGKCEDKDWWSAHLGNTEPSR